MEKNIAERVLPPLSLYVHLPWCVQKCPYCDFNSHALKAELPEADYVQSLLADLTCEHAHVQGRTVSSVFIGGGTPSLFSPQAIADLMQGIRRELPLAVDCEITMEANPGSVDSAHVAEIRSVGVNRLSLGVQSFNDEMLSRIGRVHDGATARRAVESAFAAGYDNVNLDLMFGLPGQSTAAAGADLEAALEYAPSHVSRYQLTLEPNTPFHRFPPTLPDHDVVFEMQDEGHHRLAAAGYNHYEVSAFAKRGAECRHNVNYWSFGDYLGIGAGAHGKRSRGRPLHIERITKVRHPRGYLDAARTLRFEHSRRRVADEDVLFEFMLNALRLTRGFEPSMFEARTGLAQDVLRAGLCSRVDDELIVVAKDRIRASEKGQRFLNDLVACFLPRSA